ncbi:cell division cycle protein [Anaeramoeba ignava]|uniref:Cell division cycle protein n=1 Tax=Anaeramoeba ignava TaxID=1746090 RepID=A0A9Q0LHT9_ANAIG|nr:cell division cycle protein [Anaeramoeba ignava]
MSLQNALKSVQLKKQTQQNSTENNLNGFFTEQELRDGQKQVLEVNIENWIELLESKNLTFPTKFVSISIQEAKSLKECCEQQKKYGKIEENKLSELNDLKKKLNQEIKDLLSNSKFNQDGIFMKMSSRSAKDAIEFHPNFPIFYKNQLLDLKKPFKDISENEKLFALIEASKNCLKVKNADDIIFLVTHSDRIWMDMSIALENIDIFNESFVLRTWFDIDADLEFRGYVFNNNLNALSQYFQYFSSPRLVEQKEEIQKIILNFFENEVKPCLSTKFTNYVIDFYQELFKNGPFEFRITEKPRSEQKAELEKSWKEIN